MYSTITQNVIEVRKSTRTFLKQPLTTVDLEKISTYLKNSNNLVGPFGNQIEFELIIEKEEREKERTEIGLSSQQYSFQC